MKVTTLATLAAAVATVGGVSAVFASTSAASPSASRATVNRSQFDKPQQNPYFPLEPGTVSRYRGTEDGDRYRERVVVTHRTKRIQGVTTTVVSDILRRG